MIEVHNLVKLFSRVRAVDGVSFQVGPGEVFGLLGPNGAGKSTTLRAVLDIVKPDAGTIRVLGHALNPEIKSRIGYMPEERGLYRNFGLRECLTYLGALKGLTRREAHRRADAWLERAGLAPYARRKIRELSKGMTQKAQFLATILHDPDLLLLDEPFQGLDPVNTDLLKSWLLELQQQGKAIVLSTHNMNQVEELCTRILLIDGGRTVLYGPLADIQARYAAYGKVIVDCDRLPDGLPGVARVERKRAFELTLEDHASAGDLLRHLALSGVSVRRFEVAPAPLEDIFIRAVKGVP